LFDRLWRFVGLHQSAQLTGEGALGGLRRGGWLNRIVWVSGLASAIEWFIIKQRDLIRGHAQK
jgi:hypothetical protein